MSHRWALMERVEAPDVENPTRTFMVRWRLVQTPWFGLYVHRLNAPDRRTTLHDHPWPFVSFVLRGGYTEEIGIRAGRRGRGPVVGRRLRSWGPGSVHRMRRTDAHTITWLHRTPTWTLVLVGRRATDPGWGYWDETGWTPHDRHPHGVEFAAAHAARHERGSSMAREVDARPGGLG
jgi:hypothetical protein